MSTHAKDSWMFSRLPYLGSFCAAFMQPNRRPGLPYFAAFPFLIAVTAALLTMSGTVEAVYYNPWHAFDSVQFINRSVNHGWLVHAYHATGTALIFGLAYLYIFRLMLTRAYRAPGEFVWILAVTLLLVLCLTGWLGFVLTGGAAGAWSLTNAANAAVHLAGLPGAVGLWFFGGPAGEGTLARLAVFHALLAVCLLLLLWLLHASQRHLEPASPPRAVAFYPHYLAQYFTALVVFAFIFAIFLFYAPHFGNAPMNAVPAAIPAMPVVAGLPWYLAPMAGLISVSPHAGGALLLVLAAAAVLYALPWLDRSGGARPGRLYRLSLWLLALDVLGLGAMADSPTCPISAVLCGVFTIWYFFHFLVLTPVVTAMEAE